MIIENFVTFLSKIMVFSSYVQNQSCFDKPLSAEDERKYLKLTKEGDKKARDILIKHNLRLVAHVVKKYSNAGEADDLIGVGSIGLIKAINTFEEGKGSQLSTYAARCIENEILMLIRVSKKHKNVLSLNDPYGVDKDGNEIMLKDVVIDDDKEILSQVENKILSDKLTSLIKLTLTKREAEIIFYRYGLANFPVLTQREIAKKLGISRSYISRLEKKALEIIKAELEKENS